MYDLPSGLHAASEAGRAEDTGSSSPPDNSIRSDKRPPCKGCTASVQVDESRIARIIDALAAYPDQCVDDDTYAARMSACESCPSLAYDTTCMHCGCFVALRAKFKDKACPYPGQAKW